MDVHPPYRPIHSLKEFLIHLLAITIGLLIALGLEATVEWVHHRHLVKDARASLFEEMRDNRGSIEQHLRASPGQIDHLQKLLSRVEEVETGHARPWIEHYPWTSASLYDSSWSAALSTSATVYMNEGEVRRYTQIYALQQTYSQIEERNLEERTRMFAFLDLLQEKEKPAQIEFESAKQSILEQVILIQEMNEVEQRLDERYKQALEQKN